MAYPTTLAYKISSPAYIGSQPIDATSTTQGLPLGTRVRAVDSSYGEGEFVYLKGVASTAAGDFVVFDAKAGTTTRAVAGTTKTGSVAVAMSANVASQYGWYQIWARRLPTPLPPGPALPTRTSSRPRPPGRLRWARPGRTSSAARPARLPRTPRPRGSPRCRLPTRSSRA